MANLWNPFITTQRDILRTDELAAKDPVIAGVLSFFFAPVGLLYLNRGINALKIFGYIFAMGFLLGLVSNRNDENTNGFSNLIGLAGAGAITAEQVMTINKARQRQKEKSTSVSAYSHEVNNNSLVTKTSQDAVQQLRQLKEKFDASEISEEEFKLQKQRILGSL